MMDEFHRALCCPDNVPKEQIGERLSSKYHDLRLTVLVGHAVALQLVRSFLAARFSGADRHRRRLKKVAALESSPVKGAT